MSDSEHKTNETRLRHQQQRLASQAASFVHVTRHDTLWRTWEGGQRRGGQKKKKKSGLRTG